MRFEIRTSDLVKAEELLDNFITEGKEEYKKQLEKANEMLKNIPSLTPIPKIELPLEMTYFRDDEKIVFIVGIKKPKIFGKKIVKKMEFNLKSFLLSLGLTDVEIRYAGD